MPLEQCPALVLNSDFRPLSHYPLSLWSWQDSIKAVILDRVNIVANYSRQIRSPSFEMYVPSVISLKNYKFLQITGTYMFNLMFSSFIVVALVAFGHFSKAGELGLVISFWISLTQIFSSNIRSIVISENKIEYAFQTLFFRIFMSIFFYLVAYFVILKLISFENINLIIIFSLLILVQWVNEMSLVKSEIQRDIKIFSIYIRQNQKK